MPHHSSFCSPTDRELQTISAMFSSCALIKRSMSSMSTSFLTVSQLFFISYLFPLFIFFVLSYTAYLYGQHWWLKKCRLVFWSMPLGIVKVIISVLVGAPFSLSNFPQLLLFTQQIFHKLTMTPPSIFAMIHRGLVLNNFTSTSKYFLRTSRDYASCYLPD